ncbi:MAG TPA: type II toxin-antitoxin system prevent-host-death family antitoxin [Thermoanaerobaculia bacterium]|jgi:antitoxin (DNA-binding transcriptional repressor) of toxin-antitoxin stability system
MKSVQVSELREKLDEYIEAARHGENVEIVDGTTTVALLMKPHETNEARFERLVREGKIEPPTRPLPDDFLTRPLIDLGGSVVEQLLEDRRTGR